MVTVAFLFIGGFAPPAIAPALEQEWPLPNGRMFTQTSAPGSAGYSVVDEGGIPFWTFFQRFGGVDALGYPISRPFTGPGGFRYQAFQRGVMQWRPEREEVWLTNIFEWLTDAGWDARLAAIGIPPPVADDGSRGDWQEAQRIRLGWLTEPAIRDAYTAPGLEAAIQLYGLPQSQPQRSGPFIAQRFQRITLQLWVEPVPGMPSPGQVVPVLGGAFLAEAGLIPSAALAPETAGEGLLLQTANRFLIDGNYPQAAVAYRTFLATPSDQGRTEEAWIGLAQAYLLDGQATLAHQTLLEFRSRYPASPRQADALAMLAAAERGFGRESEAARLYSAAIPLHPTIAPYLSLQLGEALAATEVWGDAIEALRQALAGGLSQPAEVDARDQLASAYLAVEDLLATGAQYEALSQLARTSGGKASYADKAASAYQKGGEQEKARAMWQRIVVEYPSAKEAPAALKALLALDPTSVNSLSQGMVYYYAEDYDSALQAFNRYLAGQTDADGAGRARYYRAFVRWFNGERDQALAELEAIPNLLPDHPLADDALWQAAFLRESVERYEQAAQAYRRFADRYPSSNFAPEALFRAGLIYYQLRDDQRALDAWQVLLQQAPTVSWRGQALLWLAKATQNLGRPQEAQSYLVQAASLGGDYYALRAEALLQGDQIPFGSSYAPIKLPNRADEALERLALQRWVANWAGVPVDQLDQLPAPVANHRAFQRGQELARLGFRQEASWEYRELVAAFARDPSALLGLAFLWHDQGFYNLAFSAGTQLLRLSGNSLEASPHLLQWLLYPTAYANLVDGEARKRNLDPALLLAMIRQESAFDPYAESVSVARGLTQVIPSTGREIAQNLGRASFDSEELFKPYLSIEFGTWYLATQRRFFGGDIFLGLAAYNAGPGNVRRWRGNDPSYDLDMLVEDAFGSQAEAYVKLIAQHYAVYQRLYRAP